MYYTLLIALEVSGLLRLNGLCQILFLFFVVNFLSMTKTAIKTLKICH